VNWLTDGSLSFAHPWVLALLLASAAARNAPEPAWSRVRPVVFSSLQPLLAKGRPRKVRAGGFQLGLLLLAMAFLIVALARPQQGKVISHVEASGIDIMLALDVSRSMLAEDFTIGAERSNRLEAVSRSRRSSLKVARMIASVSSPLPVNLTW
jgi:Ca-activated chloride channel family protein